MPDVGVFIDAHHVLGINGQHRPALKLIERIEVLAAQLSLGSGLSHRVIAADCSEAGPRGIAEDFGLRGGFRIRHCPQWHHIDIATALSSEIYDALQLSNLRTVVVVASPRPYLPMFDVLHRQGRQVISLTTDRGQPEVADLAVELDLDPSVLERLLIRAVGELNQQNVPATEGAVTKLLRQTLPEFAPRNYGFRTLKEAIERFTASMTQQPNGVLRLIADAGTSAAGPDAPPSTVPDTSGFVVHRDAAALICKPLAAHRLPPEGFLDAMREAVNLLMAESAVRDAALTFGVPLEVFAAGMRAAAPNYTKTPARSPLQLFMAAFAGTQWKAVRQIDKHMVIRCVVGSHVPAGFTVITASTDGEYAADAVGGAGSLS